VQPQRQALLQLSAAASEAVQHARHAAAAKARGGEDLCEARARVPAVHEERLAQLECEPHLRLKPALLHVRRAEVPVEVQAAFTWGWGSVCMQQ
jgi:hypothetical protein